MPIFMQKNGIIRLNKLSLLIKKIEAYDADTYILSHHEKPSTKQEMETELKLMKDCARLVVNYQGNRDLMEQELAKQPKPEINRK